MSVRAADCEVAIVIKTLKSLKSRGTVEKKPGCVSEKGKAGSDGGDN